MMFASRDPWLKGSTIYIRKKFINDHSMLFCLKALAHYKDFHKDFSEKIFVKIFVHA